MFNKRLLTVEDYNSIVEHFGKALTDYYTLDTRVLIDENLFAYDFIEIVRESNSIQFFIQNSLWTGGFYIKECNIQNYSINTDVDTITISGNGLDYVVLVLELSTEFPQSSPHELPFNPVYTPIIRPFYEDIGLEIGFMTKSELPVSMLPLYDLINEREVHTNNEELVNIDIPANISREFDYLLKTETVGSEINYSFPYIRLKCSLPIIIETNNIFKDKVNLISFRFLFDDEYDITDNMLFSDNNITLKVNGRNYPVNNYNNGSFDFIVDLTGYFGDIINIELIIGGNGYLNSSSLNFIEEVNYFTTDDILVLKSEIEDNNGADTIIYGGNELEVAIDVNRDVSIEFSKPITNDNDVIPFIVDNEAVLTLKNLDYTSDNDSNVILVDDGDVICLNCNFENCRNTVINSKKGDITIENSVFSNNYSCISVNGNLSLYNSTFNLDDGDYVDTDSVAFIEVLNALTIDYCKFNIELSDLENLSLSYLFFKIGKNCIVNNVKASNLVVNQSFPVKHNTSNVEVQSSRFIIQNSTNKCMIWTVEDTNTVYYNDMVVEYV